MGAYTFISSRDPVDGDPMVYQLAIGLAGAGHEVALFLVENGTFLARSGACDALLTSVTDAGVAVLADDFAMKERGIVGDVVSDGVSVTKLDVLVDHLAAGRKVAWH